MVKSGRSAVCDPAHPKHGGSADPTSARAEPPRNRGARARGDGRNGLLPDPVQASPEKGQRIIDAAVPALLADVKAFSEEVVP